MNDSNRRYQDEPEDDEDDVRLKAFALLNRLGPSEDDDESTWPEKPIPQPRLSSYQRNDEMKPHNDALRREARHVNSTSEYYEEWGVAGLFVCCVADACKKSAEYAARIGYETIYPDTREAEGDFEKVSILPTYGNTGQSSGER